MADLFNDVLGDAIAIAVRRAVDGVGRAPLGELGRTQTRRATRPTPADPDRDQATALVPPGPDVEDPYEVLGVARGASWGQITAAHRRWARAWHPDGADPDDEVEQARREELIRRLNVAYAELRIRRGR